MGQFIPLRRSTIAGSWFPADREALLAEVDAHLADATTDTDQAADDPDTSGVVTGLIAPHAGLIYSGPVAAYAYHAVMHGSYEVVVVVGPSHFVSFEGVSILPKGAFDTPMGPAPIDAETADRILEGSVVFEYPRAHEREHSIEMQLPFLRRVLPNAPFVPLVMGRQTRETVMSLADTLTRALRGHRALLVASTDLSHYFDAARAAQLDARVVDYVDRFDAEGLLEELERYPEHERGRYVACGGGPAATVMHAAHALGATRSRVIQRADSGDVSGDKTQVVGYLAAAIHAEQV